MIKVEEIDRMIGNLLSIRKNLIPKKTDFEIELVVLDYWVDSYATMIERGALEPDEKEAAIRIRVEMKRMFPTILGQYKKRRSDWFWGRDKFKNFSEEDENFLLRYCNYLDSYELSGFFTRNRSYISNKVTRLKKG
jgi:hypothetical protein